jgi:hypothetical protein
MTCADIEQGSMDIDESNKNQVQKLVEEDDIEVGLV